MEFTGDKKPTEVRLYLVAKNLAQDTQLFDKLNELISPPSKSNSMAVLASEDLHKIIKSISIPDEHPVFSFISQPSLEDPVTIETNEIHKLDSVPRIEETTPEQHAKLKASSEKNGRMGEEFVNAYFHLLKEQGELEDYQWTASFRPLSPYDFRVKREGTWKLIEVKTTGDLCLKNKICISTPELRKLANEKREYDIYRVYDLTEETAKLRIAENPKEFAIAILDKLKLLPDGVDCDSVSINPKLLNLNKEEILLDTRHIDE